MKNITNEMIITSLRDKGLRATPQRISVYKFLLQNPIHPSAEEIYNAVVKENPTFSKTTIYNSLNALVENGLAITVKINAAELRYDGTPDYHGHFICDVCSKIYDFTPEKTEYNGLDGFKIKQEDVYFRGVCKSCL